MKKSIPAIIFTTAYAFLLSLCLGCFLNLLGMAISLDGLSVELRRYPRFIPFCIIVGLLAFVALVALFIFNLKASDKFGITKKIWWSEIIITIVLSVPMTMLVEMLFDFLQKTL